MTDKDAEYEKMERVRKIVNDALAAGAKKDALDKDENTERVRKIVNDALAKNRSRQPLIMIIRQSTRESIVQDSYMFGCLIVSMAVGWLLNSTILAVIAGALFLLMLFTQAFRQQRTRFTIQEARARLDKLEKELNQ